MNSLAKLERRSCIICRESDICEEIVRLNKNGWYVTSGEPTDKIGQFALQAMYIGVKIKDESFVNQLHRNGYTQTF